MRIDSRSRNIQNFRDLGGLETNDGRKVKKGIFFRGAGLGYFKKEELEEFEKLGIKTIMDLRSRMESEMLPDPDIKGAELIEHSGLEVKGSEDIDWSPEGMRKIGGEAMEQLERIRWYYRHIAFDNEAYKIMMKQIEEGNVPLYFHCATGKDRTGVAALVILKALGVREDEIKKDYLLSNLYRQKILEKALKKVESIAVNNPEINELITLQDGVEEKTIDIVMASILEKYGSYEAYLEAEYGLDESKRQLLRNKYLD